MEGDATRDAERRSPENDSFSSDELTGNLLYDIPV
jgi:hypothetical protein